MANRTVKDAKSIKGTNPQYLIEKIIRTRIYDCKYWKEECFALTAELLVDKAMEIRFIGGVYAGNVKPSPFLCLVLKMLQIQPEKDIIVEFIKNEDFKYVRALGAYYMRLTGTSLDCYNYLEPLLNDNRKLRRQNRDGAYELVYMDEFIDDLLREERVCDVILPRLQKRQVLEDNNELQLRLSVLEDSDNEDLDEELKEAEEKEDRLETKKRKMDVDEKTGLRHDRNREERRRHMSLSSNASDSSPERHRRRDKNRKSSRDRERGRERRREKTTRDSSKDRDRERRRNREHDHSTRRERSSERDRNRERGRDRGDRDRHRSNRH